jgi:hypothetical protein
MGKLAKAAVLVAVIVVLGGLTISPCYATVAGDIKAGLPMTQVINNGLAAGMSIDAIMGQALEAGADPCSLVKAAVALKIDLAAVFKSLSDLCAAYPNLSVACSPCALMQCAVTAGVDMVTDANAMMAAGGNLQQVRDCLAGLGYPDAESFAYVPGPPIMPAGIGPTFPGGGGGGGGTIVVVASPGS